ncbi:MAG: hypothetical protein ABIW03_01125, partial [Sphingomicrobium sp.]
MDQASHARRTHPGPLGSEVDEKQQLDVDRQTFRALLLDERRNLDRATRWTTMSSSCGSPVGRTPWARTNVNPSDSIPGDAWKSPSRSTLLAVNPVSSSSS